MAQQAFNTSAQLLDDRVLSSNDRLEVELEGKVSDSERFRLAKSVQDLGIPAE